MAKQFFPFKHNRDFITSVVQSVKYNTTITNLLRLCFFFSIQLKCVIKITFNKPKPLPSAYLRLTG